MTLMQLIVIKYLNCLTALIYTRVSTSVARAQPLVVIKPWPYKEWTVRL